MVVVMVVMVVVMVAMLLIEKTGIWLTEILDIYVLN